MPNSRHALIMLCLLGSLSGCLQAPEKPLPPPPPPAPVIEPEEQPPAPIVLPVPKPTPKPAPRNSKAKTKPEKPRTPPGLPVPASPVLSAETVGPAGEPPAPVAEPPKTAAPAAKKAPPPIQGPAWLAACARRQQSSIGIQCDSDTLLAQPSANIRVYTRDADLARETPGGRIGLRETLPYRYRLYVIP